VLAMFHAGHDLSLGRAVAREGIVNLSRCWLFEVVAIEAKALKTCDLPQAGNAREVSETR
jgi:hypothetical protein